MSRHIVTRPVATALHRPLRVAGVDRRLFLLAMFGGASAYNVLYSLPAGLLVFAGLYAAAFATRSDPQFLTLVLQARRLKVRYDAIAPSVRH